MCDTKPDSPDPLKMLTLVLASAALARGKSAKMNVMYFVSDDLR